MKTYKTYILEKSPLYKMRNRRKLEQLLNVEKNKFKKLGDLIVYNKFTNKHNREIDSPCKELKRIQKRLLALMTRITVPDWLISGIKGKSYVNNAQFHTNLKYLCTADIKSFYKTCNREYMYRLFKDRFKMSGDIAGILTDIVTFEGHLPTGAPSSQILAFWSHYDTFQTIIDIAKKYNVNMSLYVDDMSFSSDKPISKKLIFEVNGVLKRVGLSLKSKKIKYYFPREYKLITGVIKDTNGNMLVPNKLRKKIIDDCKLLESNDTIKKDKIKRRLIGRIVSAQYIEPNIFNHTYDRYKNT